MKAIDFFTINRGWNNKLRIFINSNMVELTQRQFDKLAEGTRFEFEGRSYVLVDGRVTA